MNKKTDKLEILKSQGEMMDTKVCPRCGVEKPIEEFALRNRFTHLRQSHCIDCGGQMRDD